MGICMTVSIDNWMYVFFVFLVAIGAILTGLDGIVRSPHGSHGVPFYRYSSWLILLAGLTVLVGLAARYLIVGYF